MGAVGAVGGLGALAGVGRGGAAYWWWRVAPPCRRHRRASQTLEFNERLAPAQGTVPRARRLLCGAVHLQTAARARLSASCGTIDAPPRLLLMQRWRAPPPPPPPPASRSYHLLPESQRAPLPRFRGAERPCCEADEEAYEADEGEAEVAVARSSSNSDDDSDEEPLRPD
ncbi:uncharacterized protein LOC124536837 [Vanessa cardui]|uniref:uncharacterized protein LOC124536837 n=1 Tax=Vanessa cardui TaxID=171605 RepID=UPI001F130E22|nr:uncharacterized protein LOC124536837 [Vanessa cardui]